MSDVLVVTTSVRMLDRVHGDTSNSWPHLSLWLEGIVRSAGLQDWLLVSSTSGDDTDHGSGVAVDGLLDA